MGGAGDGAVQSPGQLPELWELGAGADGAQVHNEGAQVTRGTQGLERTEPARPPSKVGAPKKCFKIKKERKKVGWEGR